MILMKIKSTKDTTSLQFRKDSTQTEDNLETDVKNCENETNCLDFVQSNDIKFYRGRFFEGGNVSDFEVA